MDNFYNTEESVQEWLALQNIKDYVIHDDLTVDVNGSVNLVGIIDNELYSIPIQFGRVEGYFDCSKNKLTSLKGCPYFVRDIFNCSYNQLTSLEYCPKNVEGMDCSNNQLSSLDYSPYQIKTIFDCSYNQLTSLLGCPQKIKTFIATNNQLTSLSGLPHQLTGSLNISRNKITSLEDLPIIEGTFVCLDNPIEHFYYEYWNISNNIKITHHVNQKIDMLESFYSVEKDHVFFSQEGSYTVRQAILNISSKDFNLFLEKYKFKKQLDQNIIIKEEQPRPKI